jgi:hypothetical protein
MNLRLAVSRRKVIAQRQGWHELVLSAAHQLPMLITQLWLRRTVLDRSVRYRAPKMIELQNVACCPEVEPPKSAILTAVSNFKLGSRRECN